MGRMLSEVAGAYVPTDFIHRACLRYVQNREEASDLAQEVLIKITTAGPGFSGVRRPAPWLYRVTVNHCLDHLRRQKSRRKRAERYAAEKRNEWRNEADPGRDWVRPGGAADLERRAGRRLLEALLARADERDRQVIRWRFEHGMNPLEIAVVMGISRSAVEQRLRGIHSRASLLWEMETALSCPGPCS